MIRLMQEKDVDIAAEIWLDTNIAATVLSIQHIGQIILKWLKKCCPRPKFMFMKTTKKYGALSA